MECLGVEPGAAWWKAQMNPLSYGGTPSLTFLPVQLEVILISFVIVPYKRKVSHAEIQSDIFNYYFSVGAPG